MIDLYEIADQVKREVGMFPCPLHEFTRRSVTMQVTEGRVTFSFPTLGNILHLTHGADGQVFMWAEGADPCDTIRAPLPDAIRYAVSVLRRALTVEPSP